MLAYGINAAPATLIQFQDELGAILQNGMVNGTGIYSFGIHLFIAQYNYQKLQSEMENIASPKWRKLQRIF